MFSYTSTCIALILIHLASSYQDDSKRNTANEESPRNKLELIFVNVVYRHGARSPLSQIPTDPNIKNEEINWPQGQGQLTENGMRMQYELGLFFRKRYNSLLSATYKRNEIYVRSLDIDRCLMSAECNLAGLYPPSGNQKWNEPDTSWQPIPVHTVAYKNDKLLQYPLSNCPKYDYIMSKVRASPEYKIFYEIRNHDFIKKIANFSGLNLLAMPSSISYYVYDTLVCEKVQNLTLPIWATDSVMEKLFEISGFGFSALYGDIGNEELRVEIAKVAGGVLLKQILLNINQSKSGEAPQKLIAYSGQDITIAALLSALNVSIKLPPPFASSIIFELYKTKKDNEVQYYVKTYYKAKYLIPLNVFGCELNCPLKKFIALSKPVLPTMDITEECQI